MMQARIQLLFDVRYISSVLNAAFGEDWVSESADDSDIRLLHDAIDGLKTELSSEQRCLLEPIGAHDSLNSRALKLRSALEAHVRRCDRTFPTGLHSLRSCSC